MNLFKAIGLRSDPFSTSPNVDLFYPATEHRQCLEGLELAIRMKRGLSVIKGGIGVGKTTISRKLIQNFKNESDDFTFHLILDPKFESEIILLKHIIELFGINESADSVQDCRNIIENYLLRVGLEQGKTLVLIVDEGQNLPGDMLDVFRTLLNFETDEFKLLQLIIFGQPEMSRIIKDYPNFEDRIIFNFDLGPISLEDTKGMIHHRIQVTSGEKKNWFTDESIIKIHKNTQGYPRKITQLCHQALLIMMSESKESISEEMVSKAISGKVDTSGLLKQKKKNYNEIAVNKLLDVLQEDGDNNSKENLGSDDDWIGGAVEDQKMPEKAEILPSVKKTQQLNEMRESEKPEFPNGSKPLKFEKEILLTSEKKDLISEFLPDPGKYHKHIKKRFLNILPFDKVLIGVHVDHKNIYTAIIQERKRIKYLIGYDIFHFDDVNFDIENDFSIIIEHIKSTFKNLYDGLLDFEDANLTALKSLKAKDSLAIVLNHPEIISQIVEIPKEGEKDKNQILNWTLSKSIKFPIEEAFYTYKKQKEQAYFISLAKAEKLNKYGKELSDQNFTVKKWYPVAQSILNAFIWNYYERLNKTTLIIHIGYNDGFILGYEKLKLKLVKPLFLGFSGLTSSLHDNESFNNLEEKNLDSFQIPKSFFSSFDEGMKRSKYDDVFRPIFENWAQEITMNINSIRTEMNFTETTKVLLSGQTNYIKYMDKFVESISGIESNYMNPVRNLKLNPGLDLELINIRFPLLSASIGSALGIENTPNLLPQNFKKIEIFRWLNRGGLALLATTIILCLGLTGQKKLSTNSLITKLDPMVVQKQSMAYVEEKHKTLSKNTESAENQIKKLSYDTDYSSRILTVNRILSFYTPKEIKISLIKFQKGWDKKAYKKIGRDLVPIVQKQDEHLNVVRLKGSVNSNPALLDGHFENFIAMLEETNLFKSIDVIDQSSKESLGPENLQFDLKCVL
ncbi:MAG: AAA family ATPase [Candidatus Neomarinimicrobiota bacterium]